MQSKATEFLTSTQVRDITNGIYIVYEQKGQNHIQGVLKCSNTVHVRVSFEHSGYCYYHLQALISKDSIHLATVKSQ